MTALHVQGLDLAPWISEPTSSLPHVYDLYAVCEHQGGLGGGHYTAVVKCAVRRAADDSHICAEIDPMTREQGGWFRVNDSFYRPIAAGRRIAALFPASRLMAARAADDVCTAAAYMLFYKRRSVVTMMARGGEPRSSHPSEGSTRARESHMEFDQASCACAWSDELDDE